MTWQKGQSGNPAGRPKGAKDQLSKAVMQEMLKDWEKHGVAVIEEVRKKNPAQYLQFIGRVLPQQSDVNIENGGSAESLSTAEILSILESRKQSA